MSGPGVPAVTFVFADWAAMFPEFATVSPAAAQGYFNQATLFCANKIGPVPDVTSLTILLYMVTAHIAYLFSAVSNGTAKNPGAPVGRLSDATEGSVSVSFANDYPPGSAQWWQQSRYGSFYWQATAVYRTFQYRAACYPVITLSMIPWVYGNTGS